MAAELSVLAVFDLRIRIKNNLAKTRQDQIAPPIVDQDLGRQILADQIDCRSIEDDGAADTDVFNQGISKADLSGQRRKTDVR